MLEIRTVPLPAGGSARTFTDITARRRQEQELERERAILQVTFDNIEQGVAVFDKDFRTVKVNRRAAGMLGTPMAFLERQPTLFGAALNPLRYQGTMRLSEALNNRFAIQEDWGYDRTVEETLVASSRLLDVAYNIRSLGEIRTPLSTNALMEFERHAEHLGYDLALHLLVNRFAEEERAPVARALEANAKAIESELA